MSLLARMLMITLILTILIMGCGEDSDIIHDDQAYPEIHLLFAPTADPVEITRVVLIVSGPDMETQEFELKIEGQKATGTVIIPAGENMMFTAEAYSEDGIEFEGKELLERIEPGTRSLLELQLEPLKLIIEIVPSEIEVPMGDTFNVEIKVQHVKELFGYTFELEYDKNLLEPVKEEVARGDFLSDDALFLSQIDPGILSVGVTLKAGTESVNGSGVIANVKFRALASGKTEIKISKNDALAMREEDGTDVDRFEEIVLKDLIVTIR